MIFHEFPDLIWLKQQAEHRFSNRMGWKGRTLEKEGWPSVILNVNAQNVYRDNIRGPFSLFTNISGESCVEADNRRVKIKEGFFYITNHDQYYTLEIEPRKSAHTFNIHFGQFFAEQVFEAVNKEPARFLDDHFFPPLLPVAFHNRLYPRDEHVNTILHQIRNTTDPSLLWIDEKLFSLMVHLLGKEWKLEKEKREIPVIKSGTRAEIQKRLFRASDYIYEHYDEDLSLNELSHVSCLSKFHFLRLFSIVFRKTPYQFISDLRVQKAKELLKGTMTDVSVIAKSLGYRNASSFSRMFFQQTGTYPLQYREKIQ